MALTNTDLQNIAKERLGVSGNVIHVGAAGNDTTGDGICWATAYLTVHKATTVAAAGDLIYVGAGTFNEGTNALVLPNNVSIRGLGLSATTITATTDAVGTGAIVKPGNQSLIEDLTIQGDTTSGNFSIPLGFSDSNGSTQTSFTNAVLRRVRLTGWSDGILLIAQSGQAGASLKAFDCVFDTNFDCVNMQQTGVGTGHLVELYDCYLRTQLLSGDNTNQSRGLVVSSGKGTIRMFRGSISANDNGAGGVGIVGVTAVGAQCLAANGTIEVDGVTVQTLSSATAYDFDQNTGSILVSGGVYDPAKVKTAPTYLRTASAKVTSYATGQAPLQPTVSGRTLAVDGSGNVTLAAAQSFNNAGQTTAVPATYLPAVAGTAPTSPTPAYDGVPLEWPINYPVSQPFTISGLDSTGWTQFVFTVKATVGAADSAALITVKITNPSSGDGLTLLNGAAPVPPTTSADGTLTVNGVTTDTSLTLTLTARGHALTASNSYVWELTRYSGGAGTKYLIGSGNWAALPTVRANPVAS